MARARNIKPGFFKNYDLADRGPLAQLLFAGLWCLADREGRLEDKPRLIKAEIFPYYDCDVNGELTELERLGFVRRYTASGVACIEIVNFKKHQSPHNTEKKSELPAPPVAETAVAGKTTTCDNNSEPTVNPSLENGGNPPDSLIPDSLIPDSGFTDIPASPSTAAQPKRKRPKVTMPDGFDVGPSERVKSWATRNGYSDHRVAANFAKFILSARKQDYRYADWDAAAMDAIRDDWAKVGNQTHDRHSGFNERNYHEGVSSDGRF